VRSPAFEAAVDVSAASRRSGGHQRPHPLDTENADQISADARSAIVTDESSP
jgi:hypothetical protein